VLLCDDDSSVREVLSAILVHRGYRVLAASSGDEALRLATEQRPDAILLDLLMPSFTGWETAAALRQRPETSAIPIIIMSVLKPQPTEGVDDWLEKPLDEPSLFAALESALGADTEDRRVLLVEDDRDLATALIDRLDARGVRTLHASSIEEAVRAVADPELDLDLLVLDLDLPEGDGFDVIRALRRNDALPAVPTVVYTARHLTPADRDRLHEGEVKLLAQGAISPDDFEKRVLDLLHGVADSDRPGSAVRPA
jgi:CheY-like chemotaxis protein